MKKATITIKITQCILYEIHTLLLHKVSVDLFSTVPLASAADELQLPKPYTARPLNPKLCPKLP